MHGRHGKITSIDAHSDGKHATITIKHGKRKRATGTGGEPGDLMDWHQQRSSVTMPKADAANYSIGQRVHAGLSPAAADAGIDDEDGDEIAAPAPKKKSGLKLVGKKKAATAKPGPSVIRAAMSRG